MAVRILSCCSLSASKSEPASASDLGRTGDLDGRDNADAGHIPLADGLTVRELEPKGFMHFGEE